ncbi:MAG TPA: invasin domain 3-containing protein, partial [Longimicrobium sp.]|nr:invasin domain 3-containing protein [Longimicrobium sp.]
MVLGAALLAGAPALHAQAGQPVRGDVDGDGRVTAADARIVSDFLVGKPVPAGANVRERGDVNGDGRVTSVDAAIIARAAAGRDVSRFPVGTPVAEGAVAIVECAADVRARSISCGAPGTTGDARGNITVGGQNINVKLTNGPVTVTDSGTFEFTVTVQNLLHQTMAADSESTSPNVNGIRVFFVSGPTTTEGSGILEVHGSAQSSIFLTHTAPYYQYIGADLGANQILTPGDTSLPRLWRIKYDPGVSKFSFMLFLDTSVPYPKGWVDIYPPNNHYSSPDSVFADTVVAGRTLQLADSVRNPFGGSIPGAPVTWENKTSNGFATVNPSTGLVTTTALLNGVDSVTAKSGPRHGTVAIVVTAPSIANSLITAPASMTAGDSVLVKVQVKDGFGRNVTTGGDAVTLTTDLGTLRGIGAAGTTGVIAVDSANGRYTAWLKSTTAGTATVTGTLNGNAIGDNATVVIGAGTPVNMVKSAGDGQTATAGSAVAVAPAVTVTDGSGNPVAGV